MTTSYFHASAAGSATLLARSEGPARGVAGCGGDRRLRAGARGLARPRPGAAAARRHVGAALQLPRTPTRARSCPRPSTSRGAISTPTGSTIRRCTSTCSLPSTGWRRRSGLSCTTANFLSCRRRSCVRPGALLPAGTPAVGGLRHGVRVPHLPSGPGSPTAAPSDLLAAIFLAVEPLHVKYSHIAVTDVPATAFSLLALVLLVTAAKGGGRRWLVAGAAAAGLATATKYNLGALVLPCVVAAVYASRDEVAASVQASGRRASEWARLLARRVAAPMLGRLPAGLAVRAARPPKFIHDFTIQSRIMHTGWLGFENSGNGYWYNFNVNLAGAPRSDAAHPGGGRPGVRAGAAHAAGPHDRAVRHHLLRVHRHLEGARRPLPAAARAAPAAARRARVRRVPSGCAPRRASCWPPASRRWSWPPWCCRSPIPSPSTGSSPSLTSVSAPRRGWRRTIPAGSKIASDTYGPPLVGRLDAPYYTAAGLHPVAYRLMRLKLPVPGKLDARHSFTLAPLATMSSTSSSPRRCTTASSRPPSTTPGRSSSTSGWTR